MLGREKEATKGVGPSRWDLEGGGNQGRGLAHQARGAPPLGFPPPPTLGAWAQGGGGAPSPPEAGSLPPTAHEALREGLPLPVAPVQYRYAPKTFR